MSDELPSYDEVMTDIKKEERQKCLIYIVVFLIFALLLVVLPVLLGVFT